MFTIQCLAYKMLIFRRKQMKCKQEEIYHEQTTVWGTGSTVYQENHIIIFSLYLETTFDV